MKEAKLTIEEISKIFVSYWILLLATFLIKCDLLAVSCESLIGNKFLTDDKVYMAKESGTKVMQVLT